MFFLGDVAGPAKLNPEKKVFLLTLPLTLTSLAFVPCFSSDYAIKDINGLRGFFMEKPDLKVRLGEKRCIF